MRVWADGAQIVGGPAVGECLRRAAGRGRTDDLDVLLPAAVDPVAVDEVLGELAHEIRGVG